VFSKVAVITLSENDTSRDARNSLRPNKIWSRALRYEILLSDSLPTERNLNKKKLLTNGKTSCVGSLPQFKQNQSNLWAVQPVQHHTDNLLQCFFPVSLALMDSNSGDFGPFQHLNNF